jgi:hypothetical protein
MGSKHIPASREDAALSEFFDKKRADFYDWVSQLVKREVAEQLSHHQEHPHFTNPATHRTSTIHTHSAFLITFKRLSRRTETPH